MVPSSVVTSNASSAATILPGRAESVIGQLLGGVVSEFGQDRDGSSVKGFHPQITIAIYLHIPKFLPFPTIRRQPFRQGGFANTRHAVNHQKTIGLGQVLI